MIKNTKNINVYGIHGKKLGIMMKDKTCIENDTPQNTTNSSKILSTASEEIKRLSCEKWDLPEHCFTYVYQFCEISKLYLNIADTSIEYRPLIIKELSNKISGYKRQDVQKKIFQEDLFISLENVIDKLLCSKLKCYYCKQRCELLYQNMYSKQQWTLDRIDNDVGHNADNVVVSCLECNLRRGPMDSDRFKYGKQIGLTFRKVNCEK